MAGVLNAMQPVTEQSNELTRNIDVATTHGTLACVERYMRLDSRLSQPFWATVCTRAQQ